MLRLYREQYFDFNIRHYVEKLHQEHQIDLSYTWVKTALQMAGMAAFKAVIEQQGLFCSLSSGQASHFVCAPVAGGVADRSRRTQGEKALAELEIEPVAAHSPQALGRSKRFSRRTVERIN